MTVEQVMSNLIGQAPDLVAIIIVVLLFLRAQEKRDLILQKLTTQIEGMEKLLVGHVAEVRGRWSGGKVNTKKVVKKGKS